jgi:hypothetical protein
MVNKKPDNLLPDRTAATVYFSRGPTSRSRSTALHYLVTVYTDHDTVARSLNAAGFRASVRGEGAARFVFAEAGERSVEISALDDGVWVEYWDGEDEPTFDRTFATADAATADAKVWLSGKAR